MTELEKRISELDEKPLTVSFQESLEIQLKDPEFRKEYERLKEEVRKYGPQVVIDTDFNDEDEYDRKWTLV